MSDKKHTPPQTPTLDSLWAFDYKYGGIQATLRFMENLARQVERDAIDAALCEWTERVRDGFDPEVSDIRSMDCVLSNLENDGAIHRGDRVVECLRKSRHYLDAAAGSLYNIVGEAWEVATDDPYPSTTEE